MAVVFAAGPIFGWQDYSERVATDLDRTDVVVAPDQLDWAKTDSVLSDLGFQMVPGRDERFFRALDVELWRVKPVLELQLGGDGSQALHRRGCTGDSLLRVAPFVYWGKFRFHASVDDYSARSPALEEFLLDAYRQKMCGLTFGKELVKKRLPRSQWGLHLRNALSTRWAFDYLETDNPFLYDSKTTRTLLHGTAWVSDAFLWSMVAGLSAKSGISGRERVVRGMSALAVGVGLRLSFSRSMAAELVFRNAMAEGPYKWPEHIGHLQD